VRTQWYDDVNRPFRKRGRPDADGEHLVSGDGEARLCRFDGVHGESVERDFREDGPAAIERWKANGWKVTEQWQCDSGELGRVKRVDTARLLEVCRRCGADLGLPRGADGMTVRSAGGRQEYCGAACRRDARNARDRRRRARSRLRPTTPRRNGVAIVPHYWAADPWLKFWLKGAVPIGRFLDDADPTGVTVAKLAERPELRELYLEEAGPGVPVGEPRDQLPFRHSVFD
jgi:hypothetical protein